MADENGRFDWLRQDIAQLRSEMHEGFSDIKGDLASRDRRLDAHSQRLDALEKESYAGVKLWQKAMLVISPLMASAIGYGFSLLSRR